MNERKFLEVHINYLHRLKNKRHDFIVSSYLREKNPLSVLALLIAAKNNFLRYKK